MSVALDWFDLGYVSVTNHPIFGKQVVATRDIPYNNKNNKSPVAYITGQVMNKVAVKSASCQDLAYAVEIGQDGMTIDMFGSWVGYCNHAPSNTNQCNLHVSDDCVFQIRDIQKGDALCWDYQMPYWIFQVTGIEDKEWSRYYPWTTPLFEKMHETTLDYTDLLQLKFPKSGKAKLIKNKSLSQKVYNTGFDVLAELVSFVRE